MNKLIDHLKILQLKKEKEWGPLKPLEGTTYWYWSEKHDKCVWSKLKQEHECWPGGEPVDYLAKTVDGEIVAE